MEGNGGKLNWQGIVSLLVGAVLSIGWLYLETRLDNLETGKTTMMAESTRLMFDDVLRQLAEQKDLVTQLYGRVRELEIEQAKRTTKVANRSTEGSE